MFRCHAIDNRLRRSALIALALAAIGLVAAPAQAQILGGRGGQLRQRLAERLRQTGEGESVAVAGTPFGVGRVSVLLPPDGSGSIGNEPTLTLTDANGRVFYTAAVDTPIRAAIREVLNRPRPTTVYFLFTGQEALDLTLFGPSGVGSRIAVQQDPQLHQQLLNEWWKEYNGSIRRPNRSDDYPHLVDAYLTTMLANRLSLVPPEWPRGLLAEKLPEMDRTLGLVLGTESARLAIERDTMLHSSGAALAPEPLQALPQPVAIEAAPLPPFDGELQIEPLAMHVPEECLYVRFAGFTNYQWFRSTLNDWGGDLRNLIALRGVDYGLNTRLERQLSLKETALSALLGPTVIADMALVGDDPFLREGAAIGMLFQARASVLLANDIRNNRAATMAANPDATETHVTIAGHDVAFLSTPDNRVRSFYAVDGDFHFVTTSRQMVERFYEAGAGKRPLGSAPDFEYARSRRKPSDADSVYAYLSEAFFRQLASPHYQIEMTRRLRSATDIELVEMARLAAKNERKPADTIDQLISGGYLPAGFLSPSRRPDGSHLILKADGQITDSLRGALGTFVPVPDVAVKQATLTEVTAYERFGQSVADGGTGPIGPLAAAVQRAALAEPGREQVTLDVRMMPLVNNADKFIRPALGPAGRQRVGPLPGDVVSLEVSTSGNGLLKSLLPVGGAAGPPTHLFAGVRNSEVPNAAAGGAAPGGGILGALPGVIGQSPALAGSPLPNVVQNVVGQVLPVVDAFTALRWYVGGWPSPGPLANLGIGGPNVQIDAEGYGFGGGFWQRQIASAAGPITVASLKRDVVAEVAGGMNVVEADRGAQIWFHAGDISNSKIAGFANQIGYMRARSTSRGNANFLHRLTTQLGVAPDQALDTAQKLLDAKLASPIGGRYELQTRAGEFPTWAAVGGAESTGGGLLPNVPAGFQSPPFDWFRGIDLYGGSDTTGLWAHAVVAMQRPGTAAGSSTAAAAHSQTSQPQPSSDQPRSVLKNARRPIPPPPAPALPAPVPSPPEPGPK